MNVDKIKNILASLRNIKDLQNIDAQQLGDMLRQRLDIILNIVLVTGTIVGTVVIFSGYHRREKTLKWEIGQMEDRVKAVKESELLKDKYAAFLESFPSPIVTDQLVNKLSEFAANRHVQILSFSPVKEKSDDYIAISGIQLNVASENYRNIVLFMKDVEEAPHALQVGRWSGKMKEQRIKEGTEELRKQTVEATVEIGAIRLQNE